MPSPAKPFPYFRAAAAAVAVGAVATLTIQIYRRPLETMNALIRASMLLGGMREEICEVNGIPIHYYCAGRRGTPIILIHGLGNSAEVWAALMWELSKEYLVYALDLPGFGKTPPAPEGTNIQTHVLYLERFLDALGYPRASLVGNSLGGWLATRFAIDHPQRVRYLYLLNSAGLRRENWKSPHAADRAAARESMARILGYRLPLPAFVLDAVVRVSQMPAYAGFIEHYDTREELDTVLSQVHVPTTIIWGERDGLFPIACARDFHAGIANSELILLPHAGHMPQAQVPKTVAKIISRAS